MNFALIRLLLFKQLLIKIIKLVFCMIPFKELNEPMLSSFSFRTPWLEFSSLSLEPG